MSLLLAYQMNRKASEELCRPLLTEDYIPQPVEFVSPPKWNLAHTSWFFEEFILKPYFKGYRQMHPLYNRLFNSYYEGAGERTSRGSRGFLSRPSVKEVYAYRHHVDVNMQKLLSEAISDEAAELVILGINHEQQHQELFYTDLKYTFSLNPLLPAYADRAFCEEGESGSGNLLSVSEGIYEVGHDGTGFSFDNERPVHKVYLQNYQIHDSLVTNGSYLRFMTDGGYGHHEFWHEEGWKWVKASGAEKPMYWFKKEGDWMQFTLAGPRPLDPVQPVTHINYFEASAYASWSGMRLPTEFEWEVAADLYSHGYRWEWTESAYLPYPGFQKAKGTVGEYNGKFMVNQKVLRGGSVVSPPGHLRKSYRNFFHPHLGWQFTGIRLAK